MIFDSFYDVYRGVVAYVRVIDGKLRAGLPVTMMLSGKQYGVLELGAMTPANQDLPFLTAGEVGYLVAGIRSAEDVRVGDTVTETERPALSPLPGYQETQPMVFAGLYPLEASDYPVLRESLHKFKLSDSALKFEPETSLALGFGFRCGFLGLLHMEIVQERLEREYGLKLIATAPSVVYRVRRTDGQVLQVDNPTKLPAVNEIEVIEEPYIKATLLLPAEYVGAVMKLCRERRGIQRDNRYLSPTRVQMSYELPLAEVVMDFFDRLKSLTKGYASLDYEFLELRASEVVKVDILLNGEVVDALSFIAHRELAQQRGRQICEKLKELIPRHLFEVPIQAALGAKIIARETIPAMRKNVLAKCYGGDITRKRKLLEKQKEGKKRMKQLGSVEVPQEAFMAVLKID
jgi:GTP-binding protein LepA